MTDVMPCLGTWVSLVVRPSVRSARSVGEYLNIDAGHFREAGEVVANSMGRSHTNRVSWWRLTSDRRVHSDDLRDHFDWLLAYLRGREHLLDSLRQEPECGMQVSCVWIPPSNYGTPALESCHLSGLALLGLDVTFDIMMLGDDDQSGSPVNQRTK